MATLFKPDRPYPLLADAEIVDRNGKPHIRLRDGGKTVHYPLSEARRNYLKPAAKWAADDRFADGRRKRVRFSPNREAVAVMLADLLRRIEGERAGITDRYTEHRKRPLTVHLADYRRALHAEGCTDAHAKLTETRISAMLNGCRFIFIADFSASRLTEWLADKRRKGTSIQTTNHYLKSMKSFVNWLARDGRTAENPFRHIERGNVDTDRRHERRDLTPEELAELFEATRTAAPMRGLSGVDREILYTVAVYTGLRASELSSLVPESFLLEGSTPTVTVKAGYSKRRREDVVPLHPAVVSILRSWLVGKDSGCPIWPGAWAKGFQAGVMLKADLARARALWITKGSIPKAQADREGMGFLSERDSAGRVVDFHALRHTFITRLVKAGVNVKEAQTLARHSTITLTMDRYAHVDLFDAASALNAIPGFRLRTSPLRSNRISYGPPVPKAGQIREQQREQQLPFSARTVEDR